MFGGADYWQALSAWSAAGDAAAPLPASCGVMPRAAQALFAHVDAAAARRAYCASMRSVMASRYCVHRQCRQWGPMTVLSP